MVELDFIDALYGVKKIKKVEKEKDRWCPNCCIVVRKGGFAYDRFIHDIYKMMYPCVLQWDQLNSLPRK